MVQKTRSYKTRVSAFGVTSIEKESFSQNWETSPRVDGQLILEPQPLRKDTSKLVSFGASKRAIAEWGYGRLYIPSRSQMSPYLSATAGLFTSNRTSAANRAYSRFVSNLKTADSASLGITFASMGQTRSMMVDRMGRISDLLQNFASQRRPDRVSSAYLELIFGWKPLIEDFQKGLTLGITKDLSAIPLYHSATASAHATYERGVTTGGGFTYIATEKGRLRTRVSYSARMKVVNPNLWLANQLGLVNLPGIAWDLIPWSFVVGMFGNFNQVLGSFTDLAGVSLSHLSTTTTHRWGGEQRMKPLSGDDRYWSWSLHDQTAKTRTVGGSLPRPTFQTRVPDLDWSLAAMSTALVSQKLGRLAPRLEKQQRLNIDRRLRKGLPPSVWDNLNDRKRS